jgi:glucose-1-phosphate adenylyltransferase
MTYYVSNLEEMDRDKENGKNFNRDRRTLFFIKCALVDKDCRIGNDVYINGGHLENFANALYVIKDGIVVIKRRRYSQ